MSPFGPRSHRPGAEHSCRPHHPLLDGTRRRAEIREAGRRTAPVDCEATLAGRDGIADSGWFHTRGGPLSARAGSETQAEAEAVPSRLTRRVTEQRGDPYGG
ncbi:hypothetical protein AMK16_03080 [Streptomyces sp. CB00455]|uniref:hypothetical protein n=1 Tax=Streptomyces sp. CB00455 TaxID=1703927 RepID=UPI0009391F02|nr:hypothetical protein [Streptomyces sp. CB00455]OKK22188.1 hypothetical protein AMK16_03080 [Streptomyces sp. CB00455]